jgi:hypothetical protein
MTEPPNASGPVWPGYAVPGTSYTTPPVRHTSRTRMFVMLTIAVVVVAAVLSVVAWLLTPAPPRYKCPPDCGRPPIGPPLKPAPARDEPPRTAGPTGNHPAGGRGHAGTAGGVIFTLQPQRRRILGRLPA